MIIKSKLNNYELFFERNLNIQDEITKYEFLIIDAKVFCFYENLFKNFKNTKILKIDANENSKNFKNVGKYIKFLIEKGIKRGNCVLAIGGGVIQDITGFICSILYRGVDWDYYPTTLLAQCDSCIGGKTSINFLEFKNLIGNFNPPRKITIIPMFLKTLTKDEIQSGIGEIIKVASLDKKNTISEKDLMNAIKCSTVTNDLIKKSLKIKKKIIEVDEFDKGLRNIMNFGHTFGHAIESMTKYEIPHGIAVGIGIYIANSVSKDKFNKSVKFENVIKQYLNKNKIHVMMFKSLYNKDRYINILSKDKKNINKNFITCILRNADGNIEKISVEKSYFYEKLDKIVGEINVS